MTINQIRPLTRRDLRRVGHLVDGNNMFPSVLLDEMTAPSLDGKDKSHRWLVLERNRVDAVAYYMPEPLTEGTWNLLLIAVDPDCHGQGIGTELMRHVENDLAGENVRVLLVETSGVPDFRRTRGFYDMLGYEREARVRDYYAQGDDKVIFRKVLT